MASMEDLIATISGKLHAGQQGEDLKELHAKLAQTIHPAKAPFRPVPPATVAPHTNGPVPPPAPVSSWNEPMPSSANSAVAAASHNAWGGMGNSPRQGGAVFTGKRQFGFSIPGPKQQGEQIPYHASVLPTKASPKETDGFNDDAFKPIWQGGQDNQQRKSFQN